MQKKLSVSLKNFSALRIGGQADIVYFPETLAELTELLDEQPARPVVGGCTNVFFGDLPELICVKYLNQINETAGGIEAECGALLEKLFDFAAGVPATVGGGVIMNFGAFGFELKDFLRSARVWQDGAVKILPAAELRLGYRSADFAGIVLSAVFVKKQLEKKNEYLKLRQEKMPWGQPNIGSIFKNPAGLSAGKLIEDAGCKGYKYKDLQVSEKHANIVVNNGAASARDMLDLIGQVRQAVRERTNILLEIEARYLGQTENGVRR
ncbi:UDP-N-acetylenolpyruvoylglucosamine reductase [Candidatus Termititenax aidoneus]|uniref:UDP-N-acetylenolpyruvoylglucosamine reductase n=1 Tax=Termititenax aidoneus TaxID=2218524 RepID=A0A388T9J8_TERA1|nr:UDP-N-acetylenolpyruvoylglucosamine reductase [Candidatus Termititenax aidoneus]